MTKTLLFSIDDASQVGEARRAAIVFARETGFDEAETEKAAIVTTELASNLVKHAGGGQLIVQSSAEQRVAIEILALDKGVGMRNVGESLRDGFSTAGSAGQGLGAVQRLSTAFEIYSAPNAGTALWCNLTAKPAQPESEFDLRFKIGAVSLPHPKETVCGDNWAIKQVDGICQTLVVDGLGHGVEAAKAARTAVQNFNEQKTILDPVEVLTRTHGALRPTRGAAVAVVNLDTSKNTVRFAGIGNISGVVVKDSGPRQMVSHAGIAGYEARKIAEFDYPWERDALLVLHSDGLQTRWNLASYPGAQLRHPGLIAGLLYRDFNRMTDDVTVVVIKES